MEYYIVSLLPSSTYSIIRDKGIHMGNRLSKIYTKTGDKGTTALSDAKRVSKSSSIFNAIGDIDELNSHIGWLILKTKNIQETYDQLTQVQHLLFNLGGELSFPSMSSISEENVILIEKWVDEMNQHLPSLKEFILPGGSYLSAKTHICRSICRRAERSIISTHEDSDISDHILSFINRLSDYLFVLARHLNRIEGHNDVYWKSHRIKNDQTI
ncbi:MAG: cob(I)alamin adenosyltransferase [Francisellaceae bacterium]|jgi:cob(I)alamin adenosyltransferase